MRMENHTLVSEFIFQGFANFHEHQLTLFVVFLALYILTLTGNAVIVAIISLDRHLHTPMYFFLSVLSASETVYTLVIVPRMLFNLVGLSQPISLAGCATQMFFFITLAINNCFLLTAMGYDRYVAICNPLRYTVTMSKRVCVQLVWGACSTGLIVAVTQVSAVFRLPFCASKVPHFFCDIRPVMKLSCIDITVNEILTLIISVLVILIPMGLVFISYILIISTILKIASAEGRKKAFATCASHLTVVIVHYGCASVAYLKPKSENTRDEDQLISVTYTVITPLLNPVVYTLRNKEVRDALCRALNRKPSFSDHSMKRENYSLITEFTFQDFGSLREHRVILFVVFLKVYILTLAGNVIIVTIIRADHHLHTPMYFFLSMLSTSETIYTLVILPRMLFSLVSMSEAISLAGCATQMFFFVTFGITNCFLLTAMGYDRYVAICNPLRYTIIMSKTACVQLVWGACGIGLIVATTQVSAVFRLPFCDNKVAHFFCDIRPVMKLSCIDITVNEILTLIISILVLVVPMGLVFISYVLIISTILKIASAEGRKKAFATCASHLTVVIVHYGCASVAYLKPKSENTRDEDQLISVTYTVITPLLNPVVYTLRNKEVRDALCRALGRKFS
ncbi:olfactory receptor 10J1-like [Ctenodactylus gundi]